MSRWWERYLSKRSLIKHTCSWRDKRTYFLTILCCDFFLLGLFFLDQAQINLSWLLPFHKCIQLLCFFNKQGSYFWLVCICSSSTNIGSLFKLFLSDCMAWLTSCITHFLIHCSGCRSVFQISVYVFFHLAHATDMRQSVSWYNFW